MTSIGERASAISLHFAGLNPEEATIFTLWKPSRSSASRRCQTAEAETPADFLQALEEDPAARATYAQLNRAARFVIYHRLQTALTDKTRENRKVVLLNKLRAGQTDL